MINRLFFLLILAFAFVGCAPEYIDPVTLEETPEITESGPHFWLDRPANPCGSYVNSDLLDDADVIMGNVEVINDGAFLYLISHLNHGWVFTKMSVFAGKRVNIPRNNRNEIEVESFNFPLFIGRPMNEISTKISLGNLDSCNELILWGEIAALDLFGNVLETKEVFLDGTPIMNGTYFTYCEQACTIIPGTGNTN